MNRYLELGWMNATLLVIAVAAVGAEVPPVVYETSIPGYTIPHAHDLVVDGSGNSYLIGSAYEDGRTLDVLVAKIDRAGNLLWTRYIVSSSHNYATGIALDAANDVWVTGWTDSPDFPLMDPMDDTFGAREVFLLKLDSSSGDILYSTFLGGDYTDAAQDIVLNEGGEIYITGSTGSTDFPVTEDAYQTDPSFPLYFFTDAFITKLSATGDEILYSTYFGGLEDDEALEIALDTAGNIIIAGRSDAADFPLMNPLQSAPDDLFVSELSADGSTLLFSTYFGGEDLDQIGGMTVDNSDHLYLVGSTRSVAFPTTPGAYQDDFVGAINGCEVPFGSDYNCEDLFVTKLATDGAGLVWSTYLGGTRVEEGRGIAVDSQDRVYVTGYTSSPDFPPDGTDFGAEIVVCRIDATGSALDYTYSIDSGSANRGNGIAVDASGDIYFSGTLGVPASIYVSKLGGTAAATVVAGTDRTIAALTLGPAFPNPFRPSTRIDYVLPAGLSPSPVSLRVYDVTGHLVRELVHAAQAGGEHSVTWRGTDSRGVAVSSGVYFLRLEVISEIRTQKVVRLTD